MKFGKTLSEEVVTKRIKCREITKRIYELNLSDEETLFVMKLMALNMLNHEKSKIIVTAISDLLDGTSMNYIAENIEKENEFVEEEDLEGDKK